MMEELFKKIVREELQQLLGELKESLVQSMQSVTNEEILTTSEALAILKMSKNTFDKFRKEHNIGSSTALRYHRFKKSELLKYL